MAIDLSGMIIEGISNLKRESIQELSIKIDTYIGQIVSVQQRLSSLESLSTLNEFQQIYGNSHMVKATQILESDSKTVARNKILLEGYHVLSEIGAWVGNRESVNYTVVVSGNLQGIQQKLSWNEMSFEQFANMVDFSGKTPWGYSGSRLLLKQTNTLIEEFGQFGDDWGPQRSLAYQNFDKAVRQLTTDDQGRELSWKKSKKKKNKKYKWQYVTKGNTLEAFLRYEQYANNPNLTDHQRMYLAMRDTMAKPDPFWKGGDIGQTQIKGDFATIAQTSTIIAQLNETLDMLVRLKGQLKEMLNNNETAAMAQSINTNLVQSIEQEITKLMDKFISSVIR